MGIDDNSRLFFYLIAIVGFIKGTVELIHTTETAIWIWVLLVALFGFILSDLVSIVKNARKRATLFGWKPTIIKQLKLFSFVIISFVFAMLLKDIQNLGPAYVWLAPGVLSLATSLILEYRIDQS